jgi:hypothetical protein
MAELAIKIGDSPEPNPVDNPRPKDGDVIQGFNDLYIRRVNASIICKRTPLQAVFDAETLIGGRRVWTNAAMDVIWAEIEKQTAHREADWARAPMGTEDAKCYLFVTTDDFDDLQRTAYARPLTTPTAVTAENPRGEIVVARRKYSVDWENVLGLTNKEKNDARNKTKAIDFRDKLPFLQASIVTTKTVT